MSGFCGYIICYYWQIVMMPRRENCLQNLSVKYLPLLQLIWSKGWFIKAIKESLKCKGSTTFDLCLHSKITVHHLCNHCLPIVFALVVGRTCCNVFQPVQCIAMNNIMVELSAEEWSSFERVRLPVMRWWLPSRKLSPLQTQQPWSFVERENKMRSSVEQI